MQHILIKGLAIALGLSAVWAPVEAQQSTPAADAAEGRVAYIIIFDEPGALYYNGGIDSLQATAGEKNAKGRFDAGSVAAVAYRTHLASVQATRASAIESKLGRPLSVDHNYDMMYSGIAANLNGSEATEVARVPGVKDVVVAGVYTLETNRGPTFIGANTIWNGSGTPTVGQATRGQGVIVGSLDGGVNQDHPSYAPMGAECGFGAPEQKLIAAVDCRQALCVGGNPEDENGHGSHTASTAAGNTLNPTAMPPPNPPPSVQISGVAPCAKIRAYRVCDGLTCSGTAIAAAQNKVLADGDVDVVSYSISGGTGAISQIWGVGSSERSFLDMVNAGIVVSASSGNTSATITDPVGNVNHRGPWVMSVAASSHDQTPLTDTVFSTVSPAGVPPAAATFTPAWSSDSGLLTSAINDLPVRFNAANPHGCTATGGFPAGFFTGAIALIRRGPPAPGTACTFTEKLTNAMNAGATHAIVFNHTAAQPLSNMLLTNVTIPGFFTTLEVGEPLRDFIIANGATPTLMDATAQLTQGNVLADFSLRGPNATFDVTKPNITAPGINIYAAGNDAVPVGGTLPPSEYQRMSGTSMSSPHAAGAAALVRAVNPTWTPTEVVSSLVMTAGNAGTKEDRTTPWNQDDVGSGVVDLTKASRAGLVMNETFANYVAANPSTGGNPRTLNLPQVRHITCTGSCTFTRTVRNTLGGAPANWTATYVQPAGVTLSVVPSTFSINSGNTQVLTITATPNAGPPMANIAFGEIVLTETSMPPRSPAERIIAAIRGTSDVIFANGFQ